MRIGFVTCGLSTEGGWARYSRSLAEAMARHAEVTVITEKDATNETTLQDVHAVLPRFSFHPKVQWAVCRAARKHLRGCDVIHSLIEPFAPGAALAARLLGARFAMTLHGTYSVAPPGVSVQGSLLAFALKSTRMTTTGSLQTEKKARERVSFGECRFIPNGVELETFRSQGLPREDFLLTTGALKERKGADIVVRALGLLKDEFPHLRYVIVGDPSDTGYVEELRSIASTLGIADRIEIPGMISEDALIRLYNTCRAFVLAARDVRGQFEGFPMVYFEANACGAPVVTTRGFGSEYAIKDGKNGFLVDPDSPQGVADAVRKILRDSALAAAMGHEGIAIANEHSWDTIAAGPLLTMYRDMLQR